MSPLGAISFPAAFVAGLLSFLSPCILPIIPGYMSFISGKSMEELGSGQERAAVFLRTLFFVAGFSLVFSLLGIIFSTSSLFIAGNGGRIISMVAGAIIILFGLNLLFDFLRFLNVELRGHVQKKPTSAAGAFIVGMAFGAGWTPCIGPMLTSILLLAAQTGSSSQALGLLLVYSAGIGLPFILAGLFFPRLTRLLQWMKQHRLKIRIASGLLLIGLGMLMLFGRLTYINTLAVRAGWTLQAAMEEHALTVRLLATVFWLLLAIVAIVLQLVRHKKIFTKGRLIWLGILVILASLELSGLISSANVITGWLLFQGA